MHKWNTLVATTLICSAALSAPVLAQEQSPDMAPDAIVACPSQQELEQVIGSSGEVRSEECTTIDVSHLTGAGSELCLIDFGLDQGFLGRLRDAAFPTQWWVRCDQLAAALR